MSSPSMCSHPCVLFLRSEEHTSELQSPYDLVCRRLPEKKKLDALRTLYECALAIADLLRRSGHVRTTIVCCAEIRQQHFFFLTDPAPPEIYPLSLHDALPISKHPARTRYSQAIGPPTGHFCGPRPS